MISNCRNYVSHSLQLCYMVLGASELRVFNSHEVIMLTMVSVAYG